MGVIDYTAKGKGKNLSSIGNLLRTIGALGAVKAPKAQGLGMGGSTIRSVFSGKNIKVGNSLAAVNGLVNEYAGACKAVRARWPLGLGKYLLDKLEVYMHGRSVGLSNKLNDFASLASRMSVYEAVLAKLTSRLTVGPKTKSKMVVKPPEWQGKL